MYLSSIINFELSQTEVNTDMYTENGEWHFLRYNQATYKLAFHFNETSKDELSIIYNLLSIFVIQVNA